VVKPSGSRFIEWRLVAVARQAENLLIFGSRMNVLKAGDMESAAGIGTPRGTALTPYICSPEVARHVMAGAGAGALKVSECEDIWALGITTMHLLTGGHASFVNGATEGGADPATRVQLGGRDLEARLAPLATLSQPQVRMRPVRLNMPSL
jgi:hypothetical protein